jgi:rsbT co-antagonist protein RsbR
MAGQQDIFYAILDNIDFILWAVDTNGTVTLSEGKALRSVGLRPGQVVGQNAFELYRDTPRVNEHIKRALDGEDFVDILVIGDATVETRYAPLRDKSKNVIGAVGMTFDITERIRIQEERDRQADALRAQTELLDLAHDAIIVLDDHDLVTYWNRGAERVYGYTRDEAMGKNPRDLLKTTFPTDIEEIERIFMDIGHWEGELLHKRRDGTEVLVHSRWVLKRGQNGSPDVTLEINSDITARKKADAEEAHARRQEEVIRAQALAIAELSTPLIPITDEILVMPLVGVMDSNRAKQVMENLLDGISLSRGHFAIIDITGVPVVDTQVANALIRAAHAARLLGAEVILTGISPHVAQTLVTIDTDLSAITTRGTLQSGISYALERQRKSRGVARL